MENPQLPENSKGAQLTRVIIALVVVLAFGALVLLSNTSNLASEALPAVNAVRSAGSKQLDIESKYFDVRSTTDVSEAMVRGVIRMMESDYEAILTFLKRTPGEKPVPVVFAAGDQPPSADRNQMVISVYRGQIDTSLVSFMLVYVALGENLRFDQNLFLQGGFALYVLEEVNRHHDFEGQPGDNWVTLLSENGALLNMEEVKHLQFSNNMDDLYDLLRGMAEGASFIRWVASTKGLDAARQLATGGNLQAITGKSEVEAEQAWLESVRAKNIKPQPCYMAVSRGSPFGLVCEKLNETP